ncbi:homeobox-leucine zipper protein HAT9-like [Senna tora]|uniref:Homeobox-leucine zipper protein HAT9-like n=1 Tax=Senna tora TaxID=362788 RepID=A0A834U1T1_9FABA|nr:homeobox-leucine zipper protein HAT9-like [Senna tora]
MHMYETGLGLGLGLGVHESDEKERAQKNWKVEEDAIFIKCNNKVKVYPSLTLGPPHHHEEAAPTESANYNNNNNLQSVVELEHHQSSPSAGSSFSNCSSIMKREHREFVGDHQLENIDVEVDTKMLPNSNLATELDEDGNPRKKLRLTKHQSAVLEDSFKHHSTLNPKQKQDLARNLNLRARQVEVWFQNRRARTKLKQTEVDCELLKKCCETLTEENKRLQKEVQELREMKTTSPQGGFYMQLPAATLSLCPSCERICGGGSGGAASHGTPATTAFLIGPKAHHLYKSNYPLTHSSAAC